jgi:hypothetical protein
MLKSDSLANLLKKLSSMALARTSTSRLAHDSASRVPPGPARADLFGTLADADDPETSAFFFTSRRDVLDGYVRPAAALARSVSLDRVFDAWTKGALEAALETDDLLTKRMLWLTLMTMLPAVEAWFVEKGPPAAPAFVRHVRRELHAFCLGLTRDALDGSWSADASGGNKNAGEDTGGRTAKRARRGGTGGVSAADGDGSDKDRGRPVYASAADFVAAMTAYYLALQA